MNNLVVLSFINAFVALASIYVWVWAYILSKHTYRTYKLYNIGASLMAFILYSIISYSYINTSGLANPSYTVYMVGGRSSELLLLLALLLTGIVRVFQLKHENAARKLIDGHNTKSNI